MREFKTTRQDYVFPINTAYAYRNESIGDFQRHLREQLFHIQDDLLYGLITYGDGMSKQSAPLGGLTHSKNAGYGILAFLVSRALGLYRLPYTPDRIYSASFSGDDRRGILALLAVLTPDRVNSIAAEILALYEHTQARLSQAGLAEVALTRRVNDSDDYPNRKYATLIARRRAAAARAGQSTIKFELDTLNSFGDDGGYAGHAVTLEFRIPASEVLYCANLIGSRDTNEYSTGSKHAVEPGEWVVINRSPDGVVELPIEHVHINEKSYIDRYGPSILDNSSAAIDESPIVLRNLDHLRFDSGYSGFGLDPKWHQRIRGAVRGMLLGARRGFRQGFYK